MLKRIRSTAGFTIKAQDGEIGDVEDYLFDAATWTVRYLVADTGGWLADVLVLLSPDNLGQPDWDKEIVPVDLTIEAVENSPPIESDMPVSRQSERLLAKYYGWTPYWMEGGLPDEIADGVSAEADRQSRQEVQSQTQSHLHSLNEVCAYRTHATDGDIGHVRDLIVDTDTWAIRYLLLDTRNWLPGKHVLIPPDWAKDVDWAESRVHVTVGRDTVRNSPVFDPDEPLTRDREAALFEHFGKKPHREA
ncbi:MAG: PRC-barrel domain containing protein [Planctomycetes bacterium]|jgi:uncharacterized protein YrrD|nr:PRC-barrel domain-containing protein [Phycisphaerae bacterium]NBB94520.1 PRC-barrel domain containing protein [Planctomycetota bacterium]